MDHATTEKEKLAFARVMVEVELKQELPEEIEFCNEHGVKVPVTSSTLFVFLTGDDEGPCFVPLPFRSLFFSPFSLAMATT